MQNRFNVEPPRRLGQNPQLLFQLPNRKPPRTADDIAPLEIHRHHLPPNLEQLQLPMTLCRTHLSLLCREKCRFHQTRTAPGDSLFVS
jgi:hypothetical protein